MNQGGREVSLLTYNEAEEVMRFRVTLLKAKCLSELLFGSIQFAPRCRFLTALV